MNFISDWEAEIANQSSLQTNSSENYAIMQKWKLFRKKKQSQWRILFQASRNPLSKMEVNKTKVVIQNSAMKCYHEFHVR